eukprot:3869395-Alexandrium_andersonii.AAC.1
MRLSRFRLGSNGTARPTRGTRCGPVLRSPPPGKRRAGLRPCRRLPMRRRLCRVSGIPLGAGASWRIPSTHSTPA